MQLLVVSAADGFAMAMVVILVLALGTVALLLAGIYRSGKRRECEVQQLLDELSEEERPEDERHPAPSGPGEDRAPWEREEDWWKKRE